MIDPFTLEECKRNKEVLELKIRNLTFAIEKSEELINESDLNSNELTFLRRKKAQSEQDLEVLYLIRKQTEC